MSTLNNWTKGERAVWYAPWGGIYRVVIGSSATNPDFKFVTITELIDDEVPKAIDKWLPQPDAISNQRAVFQKEVGTRRLAAYWELERE